MEVQRKQGHIKQGLAVGLLSVFLLLSLWGCGTKKDDSLADGTYNVEVTLEGGSGRATVVSPTQITVKNGKITATIIWSSSHYDYMLVDGEKYENEAEEGMGSTFTIPVKNIEEPLDVVGDTTAMSTPHEIDYTLYFTLEDK